MTTESWIEQTIRLSRNLVPDLVAEGRRIGKNPFCVDGMAELWAHEILGWSYPQETKTERDQRHLDECRRLDCEWCRANRFEDVQ